MEPTNRRSDLFESFFLVLLFKSRPADVDDEIPHFCTVLAAGTSPRSNINQIRTRKAPREIDLTQRFLLDSMPPV